MRADLGRQSGGEVAAGVSTGGALAQPDDDAGEEKGSQTLDGVLDGVAEKMKSGEIEALGSRFGACAVPGQGDPQDLVGRVQYSDAVGRGYPKAFCFVDQDPAEGNGW